MFYGGGAFFIAGAMLVAVMYFYVRQSLDNSPRGVNALETAQAFLGQRGMQAHPLLEDLVVGLSKQAEQQRHDTLRAVLVWSLACLAVVGLAAFASGWVLAGRVCGRCRRSPPPRAASWTVTFTSAFP